MAQVSTCRVYRDGLKDISDSHINTKLTSSQPEYCTIAAGEGVIEVCTIQEKKLKQLLGSPYKPRSILLDANTMEEVNPSTSANPFKPSKASGSSRGRGGTFAQKLVLIADVGLEELCEFAAQQKENHSISLIDKELPPMPELHCDDSTQRHDFADTTTNNLDKAYPPLQPSPSAKTIMPVSTTPPSAGSFKVTPSLATLSGSGCSGIEVGVATAVEMRQVRATVIEARRSSQPGKYTLPAPPGEASVLPLRHIATHKNGSPVQRKRVSNPHAVRGRDALTLKGKTFVNEAIRKNAQKKLLKQLEKDDQDEDSLVGIIDESGILEQQSDDRTENSDFEKQEIAIRRSTRYGIGPTLRFAEDAEEVIMGGHRSRSGMLPMSEEHVLSYSQKPHELKILLNAPTSINNSLRKDYASSKSDSAPTIVIRKSADSSNQLKVKPSATPFAPRKSSLPCSPEYIPFEKRLATSTTQSSFVDRLSRPTRASQSRTSESKMYLLGREKTGMAAGTPILNKSSPVALLAKPAALSMGTLRTSSTNTIASTKPVKSVAKGLKSRFSAMLNGRHRTTLAPSASAPAMSTINKNPLNTDPSGRFKPRNITNHEESGWNGSPLEMARSNGSGEIFKHEQVDKMATEDDNSQQNSGKRFVYEAHAETNQNNLHPGNYRTQRLRIPGGDEEPPTPPHSAGGPSGHYGEGEVVEEEISETLARIIQEAEFHYRHVATIAANTMDPEARQAIGAILTPLANSIEATRVARISVIALSDAIERLANWTVLANDRAARVAYVTSTGSVPTLPFGHPQTE